MGDSLPLTSLEIQVFRSLFQEVLKAVCFPLRYLLISLAKVKDEQSRLDAGDAVNLLRESGLEDDVLHDVSIISLLCNILIQPQVWDLSDEEGLGYLTEEVIRSSYLFCRCLMPCLGVYGRAQACGSGSEWA